MEIKYLKETHDSAVGDIRTLDDHQARVLIALGFAELHEKKPAAKPSKKPATVTE